MSTLLNEISAHLVSKGLNPKASWVSSFIGSQRAGIPAAALKQTALFRITASDITTSLQSTASSVFPTDIFDANIKERNINGPIAVQVLVVEDIGKSRWSQVEAIEADERGETTRGREIIRVVPGEDTDSEQTQSISQGAGPHKLLVQDSKGTKIYGIELTTIDGVGLGMNIGTKLILKDITVARGVALLEPRNTTMIGGKLEELDQKWKADRKAWLQGAVQ
jgi:RecQ-mediated genome instability protein 1